MHLPSTKEILRMAAQEWTDNPSRAPDDQLVEQPLIPPLSLAFLARGIGSFTNRKGRDRCVGCFHHPTMLIQRAWLAGIPFGFIDHAYREWTLEFGDWHEVNGFEAKQRPYADRSCEVCQEPLP